MSTLCCAARNCRLCQWWRQRDLYVRLKFFQSVAMAVENAQSLSDEGATPEAMAALRPVRHSMEVADNGPFDHEEHRRRIDAWREDKRRRLERLEQLRRRRAEVGQ